MASEQESTAPTEDQKNEALKEYQDATDRMAVVQKYPFLQQVLSIKPK